MRGYVAKQEIDVEKLKDCVRKFTMDRLDLELMESAIKGNQELLKCANNLCKEIDDSDLAEFVYKKLKLHDTSKERVVYLIEGLYKDDLKLKCLNTVNKHFNTIVMKAIVNHENFNKLKKSAHMQEDNCKLWLETLADIYSDEEKFWRIPILNEDRIKELNNILRKSNNWTIKIKNMEDDFLEEISVSSKDELMKSLNKLSINAVGLKLYIDNDYMDLEEVKDLIKEG